MDSSFSPRLRRVGAGRWNDRKKYSCCHAGLDPASIRMSYYVYILANKRNGTLYTGVTNNLIRRIYEHKNELIPGFTRKYHIHDLVYYEETPDIKEAILREKRLKTWKRDWKIQLIEGSNPTWKDLYYDLV